MVGKRTLVLGASPNTTRTAYRAVCLLSEKGIEVIPMGIKKGEINGIPIVPAFEPLKDIDTLTLYISTELQKEYYDYIISIQPKRVLFNPGTENPALSSLLTQHYIQWENACTLVLLSTNQY
ncbi:MAG: CoA-binding protein [Flavobacteriaceae bacterium]